MEDVIFNGISCITIYIEFTKIHQHIRIPYRIGGVECTFQVRTLPRYFGSFMYFILFWFLLLYYFIFLSI